MWILLLAAGAPLVASCLLARTHVRASPFHAQRINTTIHKDNLAPAVASTPALSPNPRQCRFRIDPGSAPIPQQVGATSRLNVCNSTKRSPARAEVRRTTTAPDLLQASAVCLRSPTKRPRPIRRMGEVAKIIRLSTPTKDSGGLKFHIPARRTPHRGARMLVWVAHASAPCSQHEIACPR